MAGDEAATTELAELAVREATSRGGSVFARVAEQVSGVLYDGLGHNDLVLASATQALATGQSTPYMTGIWSSSSANGREEPALPGRGLLGVAGCENASRVDTASPASRTGSPSCVTH